MLIRQKNHDSKMLSDSYNYTLKTYFEDLKNEHPVVIEELLKNEFPCEDINDAVLMVINGDNSLLEKYQLNKSQQINVIEKELIEKDFQLDQMTAKLYKTLDKLVLFCNKYEKLLFN